MPRANQPWKRQSFVGQKITELPTPAFLVDKTRLIRNCQKMLDISEKFGIKLRAQTKSHKTVEGAVLQTGGSKKCIVVSTLEEAELYADNGFDDILYGYPLIPSHMDRNWKLAQRLEQYHVMVDNDVAINTLLNTSPPDNKKWSAFLKIDAGNNRAGVWWEDTEKALKLAKKLEEAGNVTFQGLYLHCGNSYKGQNVTIVEGVRDDSIGRIVNITQHLSDNGIKCSTVGIGSTPSCSHPSQLMNKLTEIHPGAYVFYDTQQQSLGSCTFNEVAGRVMTRVIGHYPRRNQLLIDCGFTALTKQGLNVLKTGCAVFQENPNLKLVDMTQEIGKVETVEGKMEFEKYPIGSLLFLYPYHVCATAAAYPVYYVHQDDQVIEEWFPTRGW